MVVAAALIAAFAVLVWLGRRVRGGRADWRVGAGLMALIATGAAAFAAVRGQWLVMAVLIGVGWFMVLDLRDRGARRPQRRPRPQARPRPAPPPERAGMTDAQARDILGVPRTASPGEIQAAYRRLMRAMHPDQGGSPALAAQINAARDLLLGKN
jgi:hypothetical protein